MAGQTDIPDDLQFKGADPAIVPTLGTDDDTGLVTAIVGVTGVVDQVGDLVHPGAYTDTLSARTPKGVWGHDWKDWRSRTESAAEYPPGDPKLKELIAEANVRRREAKAPEITWPAEAGAFVVSTRYNLGTERGRDAYSDVKFFSEAGDCAWSIGYRVPPGGATKSKDGVRHIRKLDLFEYSPVLHGAASQATSLSVKADGEKAPAAITDGDGLRAAVKACAPGDDAEKARIVAAAKKLKLTFMLPKGWAGAEKKDDEPELESPTELDDAGLDLITEDLTGEDWDWATDPDATEPDEPEAKYDVGPVGSPGGRQNWVDKAGGLPPFVRAVTHALIRSGHDESKAVQIAWGTMRRWAAGGGKVSAKTRAKAAAAVAAMEQKRGAAHTTAGLLDHWDPTAEVGDLAAHTEPQFETRTVATKDVPHVEGSYEERREMLREALRSQLIGPDEGGGRGSVSLDATFPDTVVATVCDYTDDSGNDEQSWQVPYTIDGDTVTLGTPMPVELTLTVVGGAEDALEQDTAPAADLTADTLVLATAAGRALGIQTKAGRVLSGANASKIQAALDTLVAVLRSAGLDVAAPQSEPDADEMKTVESAADELGLTPATLLANARNLRQLLATGR